jgi:circadian clock protein KaiC
VSFLVDAIVLLRLVKIGSSMKKALAVLKMRGSDHNKELREFEIMSEFEDYQFILRI